MAETIDNYRFLSSREIILEASASRSVLYRLIEDGRLQEKIHYFKYNPGKKTGKVFWNSRLIKDRLLNLDDDLAHQKAIDRYIRAINQAA